MFSFTSFTRKLFCFGGNTGDLEDGDPQGTYSNTLRVLETGSNEPDQWVDPAVLGELPAPRAESPMAYDPRGQQLIVYVDERGRRNRKSAFPRHQPPPSHFRIHNELLASRVVRHLR